MAFNLGLKPNIVCVNKSTIDLGVDFNALVTAMQRYVSKYVAPVWGTPAILFTAPELRPGAWGMVFLDNADQEGALAYHDLTPDGFPLAKVFVKTTLDNGDQVSVSASHELVEMLVDPDCALMSVGPDGSSMVAYEAADPVEQLSFLVNKIPMSDFVYPSYFESFRKFKSGKFDAMGSVSKPFEILSGGYQIVFKNGQWVNIFGSKEKEKAFVKEDRRGHRSERRVWKP